MPGAVDAEEVGQITLADFPNRQGLQPNGDMLLETPQVVPQLLLRRLKRDGPNCPRLAREFKCKCGQELVDMIETQRAYEVSSKTITSVDEMMRYLAQNV